MTLSESLAALGLPAPSVVAAPVLETASDAISAAVGPLVHAASLSARVDIAPKINVFEMLDVYQTLQFWAMRVEASLAEHGSQIAHIKKSPQTTKLVEYSGRRVPVVTDCTHRLVDVDSELENITCRTCGHAVNAVWWLSRHTEEVARSENWHRALKEEKIKLGQEVAKLREELARVKQGVRRATIAKKAKEAQAWLEADGSPELAAKPKARKRKRG